MAESLHEQISAALQTRLRSIVADGGQTYAYTPDKVFRVLEFQPDYLDDSFDLLLFLRPDEDSITEGTTFRRVIGQAPFTVLIAKKWQMQAPLAEEAGAEPLSVTVIGDCVADVRTALLSEVTLGGLVWNVMNGASSADYSEQVAGWLCALVRFTVAYEYTAPEVA